MGAYQAAAFFVLIPASSYYVVVRGLRKKIFLICIPAYALLAAGSYLIYKRASKLK
jgi:hypothetical protein